MLSNIIFKKLLDKDPDDTWEETFRYWRYRPITPPIDIINFISKLFTTLYRTYLWKALQGKREIDWDYFSRDIDGNLIEWLPIMIGIIRDHIDTSFHEWVDEKLDRIIELCKTLQANDENHSSYEEVHNNWEELCSILGELKWHLRR